MPRAARGGSADARACETDPEPDPGDEASGTEDDPGQGLGDDTDDPGNDADDPEHGPDDDDGPDDDGPAGAVAALETEATTEESEDDGVLDEVVADTIFEGIHLFYLGVDGEEVEHRVARLDDPQRVVVDLVYP